MAQLTAASTVSAQERMIQQQVVERGIRDERLLSALRAIPRDKFFTDDLRDQAFSDKAWPIGHGQTISQPYMVALMTQRLDLAQTHKVLELGTGSGYQTAILSKLAGEVYTIERVKPLLDEAFERVLQLGGRNIHFRHADGTLGWPEAAPFDRILIAAGAPKLPEKLLLSQLKDGGLAVLPVGAMEEGPDDAQMLVVARREGSRMITAEICACRFVKLIGAEGWHADGDAG